jgi:hypothetical protein
VKNPWTPHAFGNDLLPVGAQLLHADDPVAIGGHRLAGRLRLSGSAVVYLARDATAGLVAVKAARAEEPCVRDRLRREAACTRRLPSTCTARLLHDGTDQTPPFLVNDHLEGLSLEQVIDARGPLRTDLVKELAIELARALAAVHRADVVHGNLMPGNVVLTKNGLRVIDFGVAQELSSCDEPAEIGAAADNPGWLAPELLTGGSAGPACDIFGWGCLVTYAATGHSPYGEAATQCTDETIRSLVEDATARDPADRPTADELVARIEAPAEVVLPAQTEDVPPDRAFWRPWHTKALAGVSALVLVAAALFVAVPWRHDRHPAPSTALSPRHSPPSSGQRPGGHRRAKRAANTAAIMAFAEPPAPVRKGRTPQKDRSAPAIIPMSCLTMPSRRCKNDPGERPPPGWWMGWNFTH